MKTPTKLRSIYLENNCPIFLIGAPRSATTCISKIFEMHPDCLAYTEVAPKLRIVSRRYYQQKIKNGSAIIKKARQQLFDEAIKKRKIFVDKNPCYLPFTTDLVEDFNAKIIFLVRDGRDVVRSMMDFAINNPFVFNLDEDKNLKTRIDGRKLSHNAKWDYSRIRPLNGDEIFSEWPYMNLFQRCSWHWTKFNETILNLSQNLPENSFSLIRTDQIDSYEINKLFNTLELSKIDVNTLDTIINSRINSTEKKFKRQKLVKNWQDWSSNEKTMFDFYASKTMKKLEYY